MKMLALKKLIDEAVKAKKRGEIFRVKTARERADILTINRVSGFGLLTRKEGNEFVVILP